MLGSLMMGENSGPIIIGGDEPQYFDGLEAVAARPGRLRFSFFRHMPTGECEVAFLELSEDAWDTMIKAAALVRSSGQRVRLEAGKGIGIASFLSWFHRALPRPR
jgi:hypothetical protein